MKKQNIGNILFLFGILLIILGGFLRPIIKPSGINAYENRKSFLLPKFSLQSYNEKTFQDSFEKALADQIPLSYNMKYYSNKFNSLPSEIFNNHFKSEFIDYNGYILTGEYLLYYPRKLEDYKDILDKQIMGINSLLKKHTDIKFYLLYIEKDTDIDFINKKNMGFYNYISTNLDNDIKVVEFKIDSLDKFKKYFYKTDHHWNYNGSYNAYLKVCDMLNINNPVKYEEKICLNSLMSGSKALFVGKQYEMTEKFCAYKYDLSEHTTYINEKQVKSYGRDISSFDNEAYVSYGEFYGDDFGLVEYHYPNNEGNLMILSNSYDNANNELIASHFKNTYSVDLRAYERDLNKKIDFDDMIEEYNIDSFIIIADNNYFINKEFIIKEE